MAMSSEKAKGRWFAYVLLLLGVISLYSALFWREEGRHVYRGFRTYRYQDVAIGILASTGALVGLGVPGMLRNLLTRWFRSRRSVQAVPELEKKAEENWADPESCVRTERSGAVKASGVEQARGGPETKDRPPEN